MSVACGRVHIPKANSQVTLSVAGTADDNSTECQQAAQLVLHGMLCALHFALLNASLLWSSLHKSHIVLYSMFNVEPFT